MLGLSVADNALNIQCRDCPHLNTDIGCRHRLRERLGLFARSMECAAGSGDFGEKFSGGQAVAQ